MSLNGAVGRINWSNDIGWWINEAERMQEERNEALAKLAEARKLAEHMRAYVIALQKETGELYFRNSNILKPLPWEEK